MLFYVFKGNEHMVFGGVIDNARNTERNTPPLGGQCFSSSSSSFFISALIHPVCFPSPLFHLFIFSHSQFFFFFLFRIESKLSKLFVSVPIFLYSLNQKLYMQRRGWGKGQGVGRQGILARGRFFNLFEM